MIGRKSLTKKSQVDTFMLDFEKAFDTPPHELLKSKLFSYGIGGTTLNWINAFLCFRQQWVVVNGTVIFFSILGMVPVPLGKLALFYHQLRKLATFI